MLRHQYLLWDEDVYQSMVDFPVHKFDSAPVAYLPISSSSAEQFLVAIQMDGVVCSVSPHIHKIHSTTKLLEEEGQDQCLVAWCTLYESELCIVVWDSTSQFYIAYFLKAIHYDFKVLGKATLSAPDPSLFLCGAAHLGSALFVIWSDSTVQYYQPSHDEVNGIFLTESFKLSGFDFSIMKRKAETEDLRSLSCAVGVCSNLNAERKISIVGPELDTAKLKYMVLDSESNLVQDSGILDEQELAEEPIKLSPVVSKEGKFCLFVGEVDLGVKTMKTGPATLATRVGVRHSNRKRKHDEEENCQISHPVSSCLPSDVTLTKPSWVRWMSASDISSTQPIKLNKKANRLQNGMNLMVCGKDAFSERVSRLLERLEKAIEACQEDSGLIEEVLEALREQKSSGIVLLVDLGGTLAQYLITVKQDWTLLSELLTLTDLSSFTSCPSLPEALLRSKEYDLFARVLGKQKELSKDIVLAILRTVLSQSDVEEVLLHRANFLDRMKLKIQNKLQLLESSENLLKEEFNQTRIQVLSFENFNSSEILLHGLISIPLIHSVLYSVVENLDRQQVKQLIVYLSKWFLLLKEDPWFPSQVTGLEGIDRIPQFQEILDWLSALFSLHMTVLLTEQDLHPVLSAMDNSLRSCKLESKAMMSVHSLCEEMLRPKRKSVDLTVDYQVEIFDLSFALM